MSYVTEVPMKRNDFTTGAHAVNVQERVRRAKSAYTTRRADLSAAARLLCDDVTPSAGDLVLARVVSIGQHTRIELGSGRRAKLHVSDEILVCYGARYAPDQFEAYVPDDLGECNLVAGGGVAARAVSRHRGMKTATRIAPIGIVADANGQALNLSRWAIARAPVAQALPCKSRVIAVLGTSMNSGKTTIAQSLVQGFVRRGLHVAAGKVTGTGSGGDRWSVLDAGAEPVLDFTDAGVPSTFGLSAERIENIFETLVTALSTSAPDVIVLEVADGLCQQETAALIASPVFHAGVDGIVFAAGEALGAKAGVDILASLNLPILAVSGLITASPLASREAAALLSLPVVPNTDIAAGMWTPDLHALGRRTRQAAAA